MALLWEQMFLPFELEMLIAHCHSNIILWLVLWIWVTGYFWTNAKSFIFVKWSSRDYRGSFIEKAGRVFFAIVAPNTVKPVKSSIWVFILKMTISYAIIVWTFLVKRLILTVHTDLQVILCHKTFWITWFIQCSSTFINNRSLTWF